MLLQHRQPAGARPSKRCQKSQQATRVNKQYGKRSEKVLCDADLGKREGLKGGRGDDRDSRHMSLLYFPHYDGWLLHTMAAAAAFGEAEQT